jgi:hypothetical protein
MPARFKSLSDKAVLYHGRVPYLRRLPFRSLAAIVALISVNLLTWAGVGIVLVRRLHNCRAINVSMRKVY